MWEQVERAMIESTGEVCGSVRVRGTNPMSVWCNDEVKFVVRRKEAGRRCWQLAMKRKNKDVWKLPEKKKERNGNMKLFWKEVSNAKGGKVESCSRINNG